MSSTLHEAGEILKKIGFPDKFNSEQSRLVLLALAKIGTNGEFANASNDLRRIHDLIEWIREELGKGYAENTRESIRKNSIHYFVIESIVHKNPDEPDRPTNSGNTCYQLTEAMMIVIRNYGKPTFSKIAENFKSSKSVMVAKAKQQRNLLKVPVKLIDGTELKLSPGKHNELQKAIIDEFASRFAKGSIPVYVGDTANRDLYLNEQILDELAVSISAKSKLPDVVLYDKGKQWLYLIEAFYSGGPCSPKRVLELQKLFNDCSVGLIFVTAFLDKKAFLSNANDVAWETEVWLMSDPEHLIHFNGDKFFGPYKH